MNSAQFVVADPFVAHFRGPYGRGGRRHNVSGVFLRSECATGVIVSASEPAFAQRELLQGTTHAIGVRARPQ